MYLEKMGVKLSGFEIEKKKKKKKGMNELNITVYSLEKDIPR